MNQKLGEYKTGSLVWPSGKALDWQAEGPRFHSASALLSLSLSLQKLCVCGHCLVALWLCDTQSVKHQNGSNRCTIVLVATAERLSKLVSYIMKKKKKEKKKRKKNLL